MQCDEIERIRSLMMHPPGARKHGEDGVSYWAKRPIPCAMNVETAIVEDKAWLDDLEFDELRQVLTYKNQVVTDGEVTMQNIGLQRSYGLIVPTSVFYETLYGVARRFCSVNPLQVYLRGLQWDGINRIERLLPVALGAPDTEINRAVGARWMIGAAARALEPGCKVDNMMVLFGPQGCGKSTFVKVIFSPAYFSDSPFNLDAKDALMGLHGVWGWEIAEMSSLHGRSAEKVKAHLSSAEDRFRRPYGKVFEAVPRSTVFVGTTNHEKFLADSTGARRFWPVRCGRVDNGWVETWRDQLWAEAVERFLAGERRYLSDDENELLNATREEHEVEEEAWIDAFVEEAGKLIIRPGTSLCGVTLSEAFTSFVINRGRGDVFRVSKLHQSQAADALKLRGWVSRRVRTELGRSVRWLPAGFEPKAGVVGDFSEAAPRADLVN